MHRFKSGTLLFSTEEKSLKKELVKPEWWNGRHKGLKIPRFVKTVTVQVRPPVPDLSPLA